MNHPEKDPLLGDREIRFWLKYKLENSLPAPVALLDELRVHNGNAIADVVSLHKYAHCYEIKSDKDNVEKAKKQAKFYDLVFQKTTLVTTERHLSKAVTMLPSHWGILIARAGENRILFRYIRKAKVSPSFNKQLALMTLWKSELTSLAETITDVNISKYSRASLSELLAQSLNTSESSKEICNLLINRKFTIPNL